MIKELRLLLSIGKVFVGMGLEQASHSGLLEWFWYKKWKSSQVYENQDHSTDVKDQSLSPGER